MAASILSPFSLLEEPKLSFSPVPGKSEDVNPLRGLVRFGPYTQLSFSQHTPAIRILTVGPRSGWKHRVDLLKSLEGAHNPTERTEYVPSYPGFEAVFRAGLRAAPRDLHIQWPDSLGELAQSGSPQAKLLTLLESTIATLDAIKHEFDVALVHFPDSWDPVTRARGFDAHDVLKAMAARRGIATQVVNDSTFQFKYRAALAWRLGIALYVKAAGVPWKLSRVPGVPEDTAYIGVAYALRENNSHFVTCCSQVFDADGGGMEFVAFEARDPMENINEARRNPYLSRDDMRAVLTRSLASHQKRNGGRLPKRLVVHKTTAFREEELDGVFDATAGVSQLDCLEVSARGSWRGVWLVPSDDPDVPSVPSNYPVPRGTVLARSGTSALVWVAGNAPKASTKPDFYQGGKSIPRPVSLTRYAGQGPLELAALEAIAMSKMDWNNDALYDPLPVTILYSQRLARTIANVPDLPGSAYAYRLFM